MTGNMYRNIETGLNALCGECEHKCFYCSTLSLDYPACKIKYKGNYRLDKKVMKKSWGEGHLYFPCSQMDMFAENVPHEFICAIIAKSNKHNNSYRWQSKNPERIITYLLHFPKKSEFGTTIETNLDLGFSNAPKMKDRAAAMESLRLMWRETFVTIEPIMKFDLEEFINLLKQASPNKIYIGADSKGHNLPEPTEEEIHNLIIELKKFCSDVELKSNLKRIYKMKGVNNVVEHSEPEARPNADIETGLSGSHKNIFTISEKLPDDNKETLPQPDKEVSN